MKIRIISLRKILNRSATILLLFVMLVVGSLPVPVRADVEMKTHVFKFYLDPALVPDMNYAQQILPKYIEDMNYILAKNTSRRLAFDPANDIILTTTAPQSNSAGTLPVSGYEVWAHAVQSTTGYSHGGYISFDQSGAAALAGIKWAKMHDPDALQPDSFDSFDYWVQINTLLHEFAHVYGAGMGEYYNLLNVNDTTNVTPLLNIDHDNPDDAFWRTRRHYDTDPLLFVTYDSARIGVPASRESLRNYVTFSPLTSAIISGDYRQPSFTHPTVDLYNIKLVVVDGKSNMSIKNARVRIWNVKTVSPYENSLLLDTQSNTAGEVTFAWGGNGGFRSSLNMLRLIKVDYRGYQSNATYLSSFDTDEARLVRGETNYTLVINMVRKK